MTSAIFPKSKFRDSDFTTTMPLLKTFEVNHICIYIWKVTESSEELASMSHKQTFFNEATKDYKALCRQQEYLIERILIQRHFKNSEINLDHHPNGAPFLTNTSAHISISHTKKYVAVAISRDSGFGIDIEAISPRVDNILKYFMRSDEYPLPTSDNTLYHLIIWSAKESIFKSLMSGEVNTMRNYYIPPFELCEKGEFCASIPTTKQTFDVIYFSTKDFVLTIAHMN